MEKGYEKEVKVVQFIQQYNLCQDINNKQKYELILLDLILSSDQMHWTLLIIYLKDVRNDVHIIKRISHYFINHNRKDLAMKLLCKFDYSDLLEFQDLFCSLNNHSTISSTVSNNINENDTCIDKSYLKLPLSEENIVIVNTLSLLEYTENFIFGQGDSECCVDMIGIDVEWKPYTTGHISTKCSFIQIATLNKVFLLDLMVLENWSVNDVSSKYNLTGDEDASAMPPLKDTLFTKYSEFMTRLFMNKSIMKIGMNFNIF